VKRRYDQGIEGDAVTILDVLHAGDNVARPPLTQSAVGAAQGDVGIFSRQRLVKVLGIPHGAIESEYEKWGVRHNTESYQKS
jgi:hypothetical protein